MKYQYTTIVVTTFLDVSSLELMFQYQIIPPDEEREFYETSKHRAYVTASDAIISAYTNVAEDDPISECDWYLQTGVEELTQLSETELTNHLRKS